MPILLSLERLCAGNAEVISVVVDIITEAMSSGKISFEFAISSTRRLAFLASTNSFESATTVVAPLTASNHLLPLLHPFS